jgi:hypothetical protein
MDRETCITVNCNEKVVARGLCKNCYNTIRKRVQRGYTTWGKLIEDGVCTKARKTFTGLTTSVRRRNSLGGSGSKVFQEAERNMYQSWRTLLRDGRIDQATFDKWVSDYTKQQENSDERQGGQETTDANKPQGI